MGRKSVIQKEKRCIVCGATNNLHLHHIFQGSAKRKMSDKYGLTVWLCAEHHNMGRDSVHMKPKGLINEYLHTIGQKYYEKHYGSREDFIRDFGKNFIEEEYRICNVCGEEMVEGYFVNDIEYYCSDECLHKEYTQEEYEEMYKEDIAYWTQWD